MAKKVKFESPSTDSIFDTVFEQVSETAREKFPGQDIYSGGAEAMRVVCLPVPAFSVRFLLQQEGWPLGRFVQIVGEQESCKSSFGYEVMRWHGGVAGGGGVLIPTEPKDAPELFRSIVGYNHPRMRYHDKCKTLQEWNSALNFWIKQFQKLMDAAKGPGRRAPIAFMVDSLCAVLTDGEFEKIRTEGHGDRHFAEAANLLTDFIMYITQQIDGYPFSLIGINHMKPGKEKVGMLEKTVRNIRGGKGLKFFETTEIEMRRVTSTGPGKEIDRVTEDERGIELAISVHKNSLAPHEHIAVEMLWYTDYEDRDPAGHFRQKTFFDWHSASIQVLQGLLKGNGVRAKRLREVIQLESDSDTRKVWSPTLGISQRDKVSLRAAGDLLEAKLSEDRQFRDSLYAETGIRRRYLFRPELDYREQVEKAIEMAKQANNELEDTDDAPVDPFAVNPEDLTKEK